MPDTLSIAIGVTFATLELVETEFGTVKNVHVVEIDNVPTNVLGFSLNGHDFEVMIYEKHSPKPTPIQSPMRRVKLKIKDVEPAPLTEEDQKELAEAMERHPASQRRN